MFKANELIHSDALIQAGFDIEYFAGDEIDMDPGFEVELGAEFLADIVPCFLISPSINTNGNTIQQEEEEESPGDKESNARINAIKDFYNQTLKKD